MDPLTITYRFKLSDESTAEFAVSIDRESLEVILDKEAVYPE